jgi:hypothetical protein
VIEPLLTAAFAVMVTGPGAAMLAPLAGEVMLTVGGLAAAAKADASTKTAASTTAARAAPNAARYRNPIPRLSSDSGKRGDYHFSFQSSTAITPICV